MNIFCGMNIIGNRLEDAYSELIKIFTWVSHATPNTSPIPSANSGTKYNPSANGAMNTPALTAAKLTWSRRDLIDPAIFPSPV